MSINPLRIYAGASVFALTLILPFSLLVQDASASRPIEIHSAIDAVSAKVLPSLVRIEVLMENGVLFNQALTTIYERAPYLGRPPKINQTNFILFLNISIENPILTQ